MHLIGAVLGYLFTAVALTVAETNTGMVPALLPETNRTIKPALKNRREIHVFWSVIHS
jgi:hypothetical protein